MFVYVLVYQDHRTDDQVEVYVNREDAVSSAMTLATEYDDWEQHTEDTFGETDLDDHVVFRAALTADGGDYLWVYACPVVGNAPSPQGA